MSVSSKLAEIATMSTDERIELVGAIWDSIAADPHSLKAPDWHLDEIRRRLTANRQSPKTGSPWEEVRGRLMEQDQGESAT